MLWEGTTITVISQLRKLKHEEVWLYQNTHSKEEKNLEFEAKFVCVLSQSQLRKAKQ